MDLFDVEGYAKAGHCTITKLASAYPQVLTCWKRATIISRQRWP